ncbi:hypothetical protein DSM100688_1859 [Bifidobacterium ramosum]|uniref:Uncharacterized protein n=1 Tax=Bifidobacterium ramosum TaxID=1798158 RepID=A0A6L4WZB9_9BIFI|nr:hypothetical protein DSM100688_1859 [Bifidobacterium ramosum]
MSVKGEGSGETEALGSREMCRHAADQRPEEALISASVRYLPAAMTSGA